MAIFSTPVQQPLKNSKLSNNTLKDINNLKEIIHRIEEMEKDCRKVYDSMGKPMFANPLAIRMREDMNNALEDILNGNFNLKKYFTLNDVEKLIHDCVLGCLAEENRTKTYNYFYKTIEDVLHTPDAKNLSYLIQYGENNYKKEFLNNIVQLKKIADISEKMYYFYVKFQEMGIIPFIVPFDEINLTFINNN